MRILNVIVTHCWYDMIECGKKTEEYRKKTPYWNNRLNGKRYDAIRFHRGYTKTVMLFQIAYLITGFGKKEWGAPDVETYIIGLGKRIVSRTPKQNRRYYLHQRVKKAELRYSAREYIVEIPFSKLENVPMAAKSLRNEYGYSLQTIID